MITDNKSRSALGRRLAPLYVAIFCQGFVLWYATEKLFMTSIGFNATTIGAMVAVYSAVIILTETPSGILADRWSRKGVLILASIALALSGLVGGLSTNVPMFLISTSLWGIYFALYSGTYDSIIYDTLLEEENAPNRFEQYLGKMKFLDATALVLGALFGGAVAQFIGLRETYFFTIPIALAAAVALLVFREPQLHKSAVATPIGQHIRETLHAVLHRRCLLPVLAVLITTAVLTYIILEFSQLWLIALGVPVSLYGPIDAVILAGYGIGGAAAGRLNFDKKPVMIAVLAMILLSSLGLALTHNLIAIVACLGLIIVGLTGITIVFTKLLHDSLNSKIRAGAASAVSSLGRIIIIPVVIVFGYIGQKTDIFQAAWILVAFVLVAIFFTFKTYSKSLESGSEFKSA